MNDSATSTDAQSGASTQPGALTPTAAQSTPAPAQPAQSGVCNSAATQLGASTPANAPAPVPAQSSMPTPAPTQSAASASTPTDAHSPADHVVTADDPRALHKIIRVVGAAIVRDGTVLCAQRGGGKALDGFWEFPGGKIEPHETPREALHREIEEELLCEVDVADEVCTTTQPYDFGTVVLTTFICHLTSGTPRLTEHHQIRWLTPADMPSLDWAPADREAVAKIAAMDVARR